MRTGLCLGFTSKVPAYSSRNQANDKCLKKGKNAFFFIKQSHKNRQQHGEAVKEHQKTTKMPNNEKLVFFDHLLAQTEIKGKIIKIYDHDNIKLKHIRLINNIIALRHSQTGGNPLTALYWRALFVNE
ncbi:protein of unknown function [Xenorhabdus doucetiae]|uniref:Uncharacterized protein n=1 Tax=Xenorhabdus doucetiae TaxID=351671 RepID=A0A068QPN7_9GAMM|nr:protein of unknown function [Xenorhabdus doucetiae]